MKTPVIALIMICSLNAFAGQLICKGKQFEAKFSKNLSKVRITEIASENPISSVLSCHRSPEPTITHPDQLISLAQCAEPNLRDAGFSATLRTGGFAGLTTLSLDEVTFAGSQEIETLICREQ